MFSFYRPTSWAFYASEGLGTSTRAHMRTPFPHLWNGWPDCTESGCVAREPLVMRFTQTKVGLELHVRTCIPLFIILGIAGHIAHGGGGSTSYVCYTSLGWVIFIFTCARANALDKGIHTYRFSVSQERPDACDEI